MELSLLGSSKRSGRERRRAGGLPWLALGVWAMACGGGEAVTVVTGEAEAAEAVEDEVAECVEERFARPPGDLGLNPPPEPVTPGDVPLPVCPEDW